MALAETAAIAQSNYWVRLSSAEDQIGTAIVPDAIFPVALCSLGQFQAHCSLSAILGTLGTALGWMTQYIHLSARTSSATVKQCL